MANTTPYGEQPAFPCDVPVERYDTGETKRSAAGLTVRDWLAAHAPTEVPDWFEHVAPTKGSIPPKPDASAIPDEENRGWAHSYLNDPCFDLPPHLADFEVAVKAYWAAEKAWRQANRFARHTQWVYAWADAMLAQRNAT